jgi:catechol-2,3-dioxygenase
MILNHINLTVTDVLAAEAFLIKYFGMRSERQEGENKNFGVVFDDNNLVLTLMKAARSVKVEYPGFFHIGFIQESEERVNEINQRLKADGFDVPVPERHHAWTFYVDAPGGIRVEVLA